MAHFLFINTETKNYKYLKEEPSMHTTFNEKFGKKCVMNLLLAYILHEDVKQNHTNFLLQLHK